MKQVLILVLTVFMLLTTLQSNGQDYPEKMDWLSISPKVVTKMPITQAYIDSMNKSGSVIGWAPYTSIYRSDTTTPKFTTTDWFYTTSTSQLAYIKPNSDTLEILDLSRIHYIKISGKVFKIITETSVNLVPEMDADDRAYFDMIKSLRTPIPIKLKKPQ